MSYKITIEADTLDELHALVQQLASKTQHRPRLATPATKLLRRFSDDQVREIRHRYESGAPVYKIAREENCAQGTIQQIVNGVTYRDVLP